MRRARRAKRQETWESSTSLRPSRCRSSWGTLRSGPLVAVLQEDWLFVIP